MHYELIDARMHCPITCAQECCFRYRFLSVSGVFERFEHAMEATTPQQEIDIEHGGKASEAIHQASSTRRCVMSLRLMPASITA